MEYVNSGVKGDLFKEVLEYKRDKEIQGYSMFQVLIMFCDHHDYDVDEIGEILKKDSNFKNMFKEDLKLHHEAYFKNDIKNSLSDWI